MKFELKYDKEEGLLRGKILDTFDEESTKQFFRKLKNDFNDEQRKYCILVLTDPAQGLPSKETRRVMRSEGSDFMSLWEKIAVVGAKPAVRMFGRVIMSAIGKGKDSKFCETEEEALVWLKKGQEETKKSDK
ncbi:STAS/SEC14 domain-containing protein [candidate division WOR-3 bacterium]|nr:STAS/SEC14 domain-containing protein [candidate division WOR-3 bacterium]